MNDFVIVMDKEKVELDLLMQNEPSLPEAMRQLNLCHCFAGMNGNRNIAVCLLAKRKDYFDIVNLAVDPLLSDSSAGLELLMYVLDFVRVQGCRFVEIGVGNARVALHELLMKQGFRVVGVWSDHLEKSLDEGTGIVNRDMIRYRLDLSPSQH